VQKLLASGRTALNAKQWDVASKAFADASKLAPQDPAVTKALQDLDQARTAAAADAGKAKRQADYQAAMTSGRTALTAKRYDEAAKAFTDAGRLIPGDKDAAALLQQAERERTAAQADADAEQKRRGDFNRLMQQGQTAMTAKHYDEAVKAYTEALKVIPGDTEATRALQGANQALDASRTPPKPPQTPQPPQPPAEFTRLMQQGQTALTAKHYDEAVTAFTEATKLQPNDAAAAKALREATAARDAARTPPSPPKPPPVNAAAEYAKQMQAAAGLEKQQKYADAIAAYKEALKWQPGDAKATAALKNADFQRHMAEAQKAATAKHFADAVKEYEEALKLFPGNADATAGLKRAREGKP
jgi:tetratricopeptide (TPR) repeat protein